MTGNLTQLLSFASVMKSIGGVVLAVVILLAMVTIHEFGHYLAGKALNFKINEFSVGFGPALFKKRNKKTGELFALRLIPLGGYCAFEGEDDTEDAGAKKETADGAEPERELFSDFSQTTQADGVTKSAAPAERESAEVYPEAKGENFNDQPPWKRIIVLIAGATMNYLLALVLIIVMFTCVGRPLYTMMYVPPKEPDPQTTTAEATESDPYEDPLGLCTGDTIYSVAGKEVYLVTDFIDALGGKKQGEVVRVGVYRNDAAGERKKIWLDISLKTDANFKNMSDTDPIFTSLGIKKDYVLMGTPVKQNFFKAVGNSFVYSAKLGGLVLRSLGELLTGKMGLTSMGGPVTTIKATSEAASSGILSFLNISAFIGVNLAVFNLLPIPALDGSKVVFCIIEWIRKKPINRKVEAMIHFIGIIFLFGFAILVDILQLFV